MKGCRGGVGGYGGGEVDEEEMEEGVVEVVVSTKVVMDIKRQEGLEESEGLTWPCLESDRQMGERRR